MESHLRSSQTHCGSPPKMLAGSSTHFLLPNFPDRALLLCWSDNNFELSCLEKRSHPLTWATLDNTSIILIRYRLQTQMILGCAWALITLCARACVRVCCHVVTSRENTPHTLLALHEGHCRLLPMQKHTQVIEPRCSWFIYLTLRVGLWHGIICLSGQLAEPSYTLSQTQTCGRCKQ